MRGNGEGYGVDLLLRGLERARVNQDDAEAVAVLWTWLDSHLLTLGSLKEKPPAIRRAALQAINEAPYAGVDDQILEWLGSSPLRNAAELLARIGTTFESRSENLVQRKEGIDGLDVIVSVRQPALAMAINDHDDFPPTSIEHPSLSTLSPRVVVCPLELNGIQLEVVDPIGTEWELSLAPLELFTDGEMSSGFSIHLDTLGEHGLSGWDPDDQELVGRYNPEEIDPADLAGLCEAAGDAVKRARGPLSLLVMP